MESGGVALWPVGSMTRDPAILSRKLPWPAKMIAPGFRTGDAICAPGTDQRALELREAAQHSQHQLAVRCRRVGPRIAQ